MAKRNKKTPQWPPWVYQNLHQYVENSVKAHRPQIKDRAYETSDIISDIVLLILKEPRGIQDPAAYVWVTVSNYLKKCSRKTTISLDAVPEPVIYPAEFGEATEPLKAFIVKTNELSENQKQVLLKLLAGESKQRLILDDPNNHNLIYRGLKTLRKHFPG